MRTRKKHKKQSKETKHKGQVGVRQERSGTGVMEGERGKGERNKQERGEEMRSGIFSL